MSQRISVQVRNKIATCLTDIPVVCGNSDYIVDFDFDEKWDRYEIKTARFRTNGEYTDVVFEGNACPMPIISNSKIVWIGVFAGDLFTSTPAIVHCKPSILDGEGVPADPTPDVYTQIMGKIHEASRVYVLAEGETVEDAPADADLIIDPYGEGGIDADDLEGFVRYNAEQVLTDEEKARARENIGAASDDDVANVSRELSEYEDAHKEDYTNEDIDKAIAEAASNAEAAEKVAEDLAEYKSENDAQVDKIRGDVSDLNNALQMVSTQISGIDYDLNAYKETHANDYTNEAIDSKVSEEVSFVSASIEGTYSILDGRISGVEANLSSTDSKAETAKSTIDGYIEAHADDYTNAQIDDKIAASGGGSGGGGGTVDPETLTGFVRYDKEQTLDTNQKKLARKNIDAVATSELTRVRQQVEANISLYITGGLKWDGSIGRRHSVVGKPDEDGMFVACVRVTDRTPDFAGLLFGGFALICGLGGGLDGDNITFEPIDDVYVGEIGSFSVIIALNDNAVLNGVGVFKKGIYFSSLQMQIDFDGEPFGCIPAFYVSSLYLFGEEFENEVIINSSTEGSKKKFKITVDDSGTISATEVT